MEDREMTRIKIEIVCERFVEDAVKRINEFVEGKEIEDIQYSNVANCHSAMIIYKEGVKKI